MKGFVLLSLILSLFTACKTHKKVVDSNLPERVFKNQGEQEVYWAQRLFEKQYKKEEFKKYKGDIQIIDDYHIRYGQALLEFYNCKPEFKTIFTSGIFYPGIIGTKDLKISNIEEQPFLSNSIKVKRFKFWFYMPGISNPIVYFFEITNRKATQGTSLSNFIEGGKLTFVKEGWVII